MAQISKYEPTQVQHPWAATARTTVQTLLGALLVLVVVLPEILDIVVDELGGQMPDGVRVWLVGASAFVAALAGAIARVSAIPRVNRWLAHLGLSAGAPPAVPEYLTDDPGERGKPGAIYTGE